MEDTFIAYIGSELNEEDIESKLMHLAPNGYTAKTKVCPSENLIFGKTVYNRNTEYEDPNGDDKVLVVFGCDKHEMKHLTNSKYERFKFIEMDASYDVVTLLYKVFTNLYKEKGKKMFAELEPDIDFSVAIYDFEKKHLIVGRGNGDVGGEANLFYGFTTKNGEIIFSNNRKALYPFCYDIKVFPKGSYYFNEQFYTYLDLDEIEQKAIQENAQQFLSIVNSRILSITYETIRATIENNFELYLKSDDSKKKLEDLLLSRIDNGTQKMVSDLIRDSIEKMNLDSTIERELQKTYLKSLNNFIKDQPVPYINTIKLKDTELGRTNAECFHEKFEEILQLIQLDEPVMLIGPAGSGKNHSIEQIARALGKKMYYTNNASNEFKLTGFIDAGGHYRDTEFYKAFKNGGIFFLDEIDNSDPSVLIVINSALANGYMAFPHETIYKHPDFRMVAAANTWGYGSDLQYIGRNALDGATLDRFDNIFFDYDRKLEQALYPNEEVLQFMWSFRDSIEKIKIPHIVSTRGIGKVYKKEINGIPVETILRINVIKNLEQDDLNTIIKNMENISSTNKYYDEIKRMRLRR